MKDMVDLFNNICNFVFSTDFLIFPLLMAERIDEPANIRYMRDYLKFYIKSY